MSSKGKLNAYICKTCKGKTVTIDIDDGVTPFMLNCRATEGCKSWAQSQCYDVDPLEVGKPAFEWYQPSLAEIKKSSPGMIDHAAQGGLFIRPIKKRCANCQADAPTSPMEFAEIIGHKVGPNAEVEDEKISIDICDDCLIKAGKPPRHRAKPGRNEPCICGSGKKYKKCHGAS